MNDSLGQATELTWGGYHKLCARKDANGNVVRLQYNLEGELTHVWNERGEVHRLEYTTDGRQGATTRPRRWAVATKFVWNGDVLVNEIATRGRRLAPAANR